jgi:hypothetical protein
MLVGGLLFLVPPEQTLGNIIKAVFLHGALVETGLVVFGVAGVTGLAYLVWKSKALYQWGLAAQKTAVVVWVVYVLSSMVVTYLAWGILIAWQEPRVQVSAKILGICIGFLVLTQWVDHRAFTAIANVVMGVMAWILTKGALNVQHPLNPIGSSDSTTFKWLFVAILLVVMLMAFQVMRWLKVSTEAGQTANLYKDSDKYHPKNNI